MSQLQMQMHIQPQTKKVMTTEMIQEQKMQMDMRLLTKLVRLRLQMEVPRAARGIQGLRLANGLLITRKQVGVLVGGIARTAWNRCNKLADIEARKDIDVLLPVAGDFPKEMSEACIDWWKREEGRVVMSSEAASTEGTKYWWQNCNEVVLPYRISPAALEQLAKLPPGLYLPHRDDVREMEVSFAESLIDERVQSNIAELLERYRRKIDRRVVHQHVMKGFRERTGILPLYPYYNKEVPRIPFGISTIGLAEQIAIERLGVKYDKAEHKP